MHLFIDEFFTNKHFHFFFVFAIDRHFSFFIFFLVVFHVSRVGICFELHCFHQHALGLYNTANMISSAHYSTARMHISAVIIIGASTLFERRRFLFGSDLAAPRGCLFHSLSFSISSFLQSLSLCPWLFQLGALDS